MNFSPVKGGKETNSATMEKDFTLNSLSSQKPRNVDPKRKNEPIITILGRSAIC